jgi:hypothetical protein
LRRKCFLKGQSHEKECDKIIGSYSSIEPGKSSLLFLKFCQFNFCWSDFGIYPTLEIFFCAMLQVTHSCKPCVPACKKLLSCTPFVNKLQWNVGFFCVCSGQDSNRHLSFGAQNTLVWYKLAHYWKTVVMKNLTHVYIVNCTISV